MSEVDDFLAHYGVPGMKWGRRKNEGKGGDSSGGKKSGESSSKKSSAPAKEPSKREKRKEEILKARRELGKAQEDFKKADADFAKKQGTGKEAAARAIAEKKLVKMVQTDQTAQTMLGREVLAFALGGPIGYAVVNSKYKNG